MRVSLFTFRCIKMGFLFWAIFIFALGCTSPRLEKASQERPIGPSYQLANLFAVDLLPASLRRVAVLPVAIGSGEILDRQRFELLLAGELRRASRFEVMILSEDTLLALVGRETLSPSEPFPLKLVDYLQSIGVDGVLQLAVPEYSPYRPFVVSIDARLFSLADGAVLWRVDESFRSSEKRTVVSAREYALANRSNRFPNNDSYAALRGPLLFSEFVLYTIVAFMPPCSQQ
jgi:hypothetical protein